MDMKSQIKKQQTEKENEIKKNENAQSRVLLRCLGLLKIRRFHLFCFIVIITQSSIFHFYFFLIFDF